MKKYISLILILIVCCALLSACSSGSKETKAEFFTYIVNVDNEAVITGYIGNEASVVIPSKIDGKTVTQIAEKAFEKNTLIAKVVVPDSVREIGDSAFSSCSSLQEIVLPKNLKELKFGTFADNTALRTITLPSSLQTIEGFAFSGCVNLTNIKLPSGLQHMGNSAFINSGITEITIPANTRHLASDHKYGGWFEGCNHLKTITYEKGNTEIWLGDIKGSADKWSTGFNLLSINKIIIPSSVTTIYNWQGNLLSSDIVSYGFFNCDVKEIHVAKGSFAASIFEKAQNSNKFMNYQVNEKWYSYISSQGYRNGGKGISDTYFKDKVFDGQIIYD